MPGAQGPIEISYVHEADEYISAARVYRYRSADTKFMLYLGTGVVLASMAFAALSGDPYVAGVVVFSGLLALAVRHYNWHVAPRRAFRRDPTFREPVHVRFAEEGVHFRSKGVESRLDWGFYTGALETPDFFFLVYGDGLYQLVPKRALRGRGQESALGALLRDKFGERMQTHGLPEARAHAAAREYVPPREPPDWR